jgi:hypothetical protein
MSIKIKVPAGTEAELNGIPIVFITNTDLDFPADHIDHVAELCHAGGLVIDLSHTENGKLIRYGAAGKRMELDPPKPEKVEKPAEKKEDDEPKMKVLADGVTGGPTKTHVGKSNDKPTKAKPKAK